MSFNCYHCKGRHGSVAEARICAGLSSPSTRPQLSSGRTRSTKRSNSKRRKRARQARSPDYSGADPEPGVSIPQPLNDAELHKLIGPTQNYDDDT